MALRLYLHGSERVVHVCTCTCLHVQALLKHGHCFPLLTFFQGVYNIMIYVVNIYFAHNSYGCCIFLPSASVLILKCVLSNITHLLFMHFEDIFFTGAFKAKTM